MSVKLYLMAAFVRDLRLLDKILTVGIPRWTPYLSIGEAAAVSALHVAVKAALAELPIPN